MPNFKDLRDKGLYRSIDILDEVIESYNIKHISKNNRNACLRYLQRKLEGKYDNSIKKGVYYHRKEIDELFENKNVINYFHKIANQSANYITDKALAYETLSELKDNKQLLREKWKQAGLTESEGKTLEIDKITQKEYLTVDELLFLNLKGLVLRSSLSEEEKSLLAWYHQQEAVDEAETKQVEELFYRKKLEIMITALFEQYFTLDERKLKNDINNYVRGGESSVIVTYDGSINNNLPEQTVTRSNLRLQNNKNYYKKGSILNSV